MAAVTGAVGSLISKLGGLLNEEYKLQKSARKKVKSLIKELECAHAALRKVDGVPPDQLEENVKIWAREVRDASYDMEDVIDTFLVRVDGGREDQQIFLKHFRGLMPRKVFQRRKIARTMDDINKRLDDVTRRYGRYTVVGSINVDRPASLDPRLAAMYKEVTELVGIENSSSDLIAMLSMSQGDEASNKKLKIVSVVGAGGLGKTTLAKAVYDKFKVDFNCSAFVPVGRNPDPKKVFRDILIEIDKDKYMDHKITVLDERQLIDELRENLRNKRYLLVIDDVWETKSWETIKLALVQENSASRVITTTRILEVAKEAGEVYNLQHLPYDKSKKLFYTRIFGDQGKCPDNQLDEVSDKILKKCDGVPLAIITMASLLVGKSREEWIEVCNSIAFRDKNNKQVSDTEWILSLSYYDLPSHLKTCLLYLSVFPEDEFISKDSLIWKWVAEGFVQNDRQGPSLFEVGNGYFNELINRSMIQAVESSAEDDDTVVSCRVHDMVHDLLRLKSQEENFVTVSSSKNVEAISSPSRVRRLTHQNKMVEHITQMDLGHVRSFIAFWCDIDPGFSFQIFKLLRVLALEHVGSHRDGHFVCLKHLGNLLHLRYLGLGYSYIHEIPEEIGALKFLQTLDLDGASVTEKRLPLSVGLLTQLICLRARCMMAPNGGIQKLMSLEQLEIHAGEDTVGHFVKELGKLRELRVLYAELAELDDSMEGDLFKSLGNLHKIQHLELKCRMWVKPPRETALALPRPVQCLVVPNIRFPELPSCISPSDLPNLTHLNLCVYYMEDQHLKILGQLPELRHLKLRIGSLNNEAKVTMTSTGCFQKLRSLSLPSSTVLFVLNKDSSITFTVGSVRTRDFGTKKRDKCLVAPAVMPNLQVLEFQVFLREVSNGICDNLGLDCLPKLQRVEVTWWCFCAALLERDVVTFGAIFLFISFACILHSQLADCLRALFADVVEREEAALRQAIDSHPNRPTLQLHHMF